MPDYNSIEKEFLRKITETIEDNISSEQFGVSELARESGMSRSNLLRKVKKLTGLSVSQFIRQVRLKNAKEMLHNGAFTVSEVSYKVGFSSTSYFIKCFREQFGFPPGELSIHQTEEVAEEKATEVRRTGVKNKFVIIISALLLILVAGYFFVTNFFSEKSEEDKSIAVLPFKNDSDDSSNIYFINGLMESVLNDLQKIEDLRVISRTSVEKYREQQKTIPEIAKELGVRYVVEGSGQKAGDQIFLNIQLIDANSDEHLWAGQYTREVLDVFELQREVAKNIATEIEVVISPKVRESIDKNPTENLEAYDNFLKGIDLLNKGLPEYAGQSIPYFKKAIELDNKFARAYAATAMAYYTIDENRATKQYTDSINFYSDQAMFYDASLSQSLIAKALFYMTTREYHLAVPYLEKALEYNPNSDLVFVFLLELYANYLPDTEKYLEYALRGLRIDISAYDSTITSLNYLHIANAFIQTGFVDEALVYINKSLEYDPTNLYSEYVKAYIVFAKNEDLEETKELLQQAFNKDTTRLDIMQEVAKMYYYLRDYENAYKYYKEFVETKEAYNLDIYRSENAKIGFVYSKMGLADEAESFLEQYKTDAENDESVYKHSQLALYYANNGDTVKAIEELKLFAQEDSFSYWIVLFLEREPLMDNLRDNPEFSAIVDEIETIFRDHHNKLEESLENQNLI